MKTTNFDLYKTDNGWKIRHRPSGLSAPHEFHLRQRALDAALGLEELGDWSEEETPHDLLIAAAHWFMEVCVDDQRN